MTTTIATSSRKCTTWSLARGVLCTAALACCAQVVHAQNPDAKAVLKSMSAYVASQKDIELTFDSDVEVITTTLEKIQFTNSGGAVLSRPDKLHAYRTGGYSDVEMFFNGKTVSVHGKSANAYTTFAATGSVDQLIHAMRSGHGIALPGADLLLSNSFDVLVADVTEAKYMGRGVIDGIECEHLAFRNADTDWQLWVELGANPIPRKMVITSKAVAGAPQYTLQIKSWKTGGKPSAASFTYVPPAGMKMLRPDELVDLDELPRDVVEGEDK